MATVSTIPGNGNVMSILYRSSSWSIQLTGDVTADIFVAELVASSTITLGTSATYDATYDTTTVVITLSTPQALTLSLGTYTWSITQTTGGNTRTVAQGEWAVVSGNVVFNPPLVGYPSGPFNFNSIYWNGGTNSSGASTGNASGDIPLNNATLNTDLNAQFHGGLPIGTTGVSFVPYVAANGNMIVGGSDQSDGKLQVAGNIALNAANPIVRFNNGGPTIQLTTANTLDFTPNGSTVYLRLSPSGNFLTGTFADASTGKIQSSGNVSPSAHNTYDLGTTAVRWKDVWCQTGAFNGSDARLKTSVKPMTDNELEAAKQLAREIGTYQWLESIDKKGDKARHHVGMTVQRAIEIMESFGLDPFAYGFIGYDKWDDRIVHHEAVEAQEATEDAPAIEAVDAWDEVVLKAGDAFSFRYDQLNQFIARGLEARLTEMEARLTALES